MAKLKQRQIDRIVAYCDEYGSITQMDALRELGCMRLASRMSDIKRGGVYDVNKIMETGHNKYGEPVRYARYTLEERAC